MRLGLGLGLGLRLGLRLGLGLGLGLSCQSEGWGWGRVRVGVKRATGVPWKLRSGRPWLSLSSMENRFHGRLGSPCRRLNVSGRYSMLGDPDRASGLG